MNKEFEDLKKSWKEQDISQNNYSQAELILMLNKKSSNNIKYIIIISVIEFTILTISLFFTSTDKSQILQNLDAQAQEIYFRNNKISNFLVYINSIISLGFIFLFYKSYKRISVLNSTKDLIHNILKFRKLVNKFIFINISLGLLTLFLTGFYDFMSGFMKDYKSNSEITSELEKITTPFFSPQYILFFIVICLFVIAVVLVYYYLVYGILLRKLKKNLNELKNIEE